MPSPIGHGLIGMSTAWTLRASAGPRLVLACAMLGMLPDIDVLFGAHRGKTHSLGAVLLVTAGAATFAAKRGLPIARIAIACGAAYASHLLLDWLGRDSSAPYGIQAFWPLSSRYYVSGADLFWEISRRYWRLDEFLFGNLTSIGWELVLVAPVVALAWWWGTRRSHRGVIT
jgi:inner membrane protein